MSSPPFAPPPSSPDAGGARNGPLIPIVSNTLLYLLIACLATECDISRWRRRSKKLMRGIGIAMCLQFLMLPLIGSLRISKMNSETGIFVACTIRHLPILSHITLSSDSPATKKLFKKIHKFLEKYNPI